MTFEQRIRYLILLAEEGHQDAPKRMDVCLVGLDWDERHQLCKAFSDNTSALITPMRNRMLDKLAGLPAHYR
jgi:hypothetical protein